MRAGTQGVYAENTALRSAKRLFEGEVYGSGRPLGSFALACTARRRSGDWGGPPGQLLWLLRLLTSTRCMRSFMRCVLW